MIPLAIRQLVWRILLFYVASFAVMLIFFPWRAIGLEASPFVQIFAKSGIPEAASVINLVVITAALSVYNSMLFSGYDSAGLFRGLYYLIPVYRFYRVKVYQAGRNTLFLKLFERLCPAGLITTL